MRSRFFLLLSLIAALGAAVFLFLFLQQIHNTYKKQARYTTVVTAAIDVPARQLLVPAMLKEQDMPENLVHPQAVRRMDEAVGKITKYPLTAGEVVLKSKLVAEKEELKEVAFNLNEGERAMTVGVDAVTGVGGAIKPGDRVDVLGVLDLPDGGSFQSVIATNVRVLAVGGGGKHYDNVTLAVNPQQAAAINLASRKGFIRLLLRNPKDTQDLVLPPITVQDLRR
ncbi:MAG TPA: Flp pilus assembly protein CpaB [Moorella mulderi]|nr:Flp pilus assembly protein CpaB [Moorella mulderi]